MKTLLVTRFVWDRMKQCSSEELCNVGAQAEFECPCMTGDDFNALCKEPDLALIQLYLIL